MIRPITLICWCLMLGSGLYLYRAKHDVELLDRRIVQVAKDTEVLRGESRRLLDEWIRLGEPEQLRKYTDQYLGLKTVAPGQFVRVADLAARLPPPRLLPVEDTTETPARSPVEAETTDEAEAEELPIPPMPPIMTATSVPVASPREPVEAYIAPPRPVLARPAEPRPAESRVAEEPRHAPPRPLPVRTAEPRGTEEPRAMPKPVPVRVAEPRGTEEPRAAMPKPLPVRTAEPRGTEEQRATPPRPAPARPAEPRMAEEPRAAAPKPVAAKPIEPRVADGRGQEPRREVQEPRRETRPAPPMSAQAAASPPSNGSMLGMARSNVPLPLPAPTPVSATWQGR